MEPFDAIAFTASESHCEITISEVLMMLKVWSDSKGINNGIGYIHRYLVSRVIAVMPEHQHVVLTPGVGQTVE
jgi:hypothetical protein